MAHIKEFKALRPKKSLAPQVAALPYDVVTTNEAKELASNNPYSFFCVTRPEIELPLSVDPYSPEVYKLGKENLDRFINQGVMVKDDNPYLYVYTLGMGAHTQTGIVAVVSVDDYLNGVVKKHELTREDKEIDRMNHIRIVGAQTGMVYLFYKADESIQGTIKEALQSPVLYDFIADDGIRHTIAQIENPTLIHAIKEALASRVLYIADGHHRAASATRVCLERRKQGYSGDEPFNYFIATIFPHSELKILPYNRVVKDLNNHDFSTFIRLVEKHFTINEVDNGIVSARHEIRMYYNRKWFSLRYHAALSQNTVENLDVSILQKTVLEPILNIKDPRKDQRIDFVGGIHAVDTIEKLVNSGRFAIGFSLYPTSIDELMSISDMGEIMPPKSTWFEPKLRDGLLVHCID